MSLEVVARLDTSENTAGDPRLEITDRLCRNVEDPFHVLLDPATDEFWPVKDDGEGGQ
jgi:hypothetical protein